VKAVALVETLANRLAEMKVEALGKRLAEVETKTLRKTLSYFLADIDVDTLACTLAIWRARRRSTH